MPILVGVGYRKRSGKDTVADYLVKNFGFKKMSWADLLKAGVNAWHGWDDRHAYGDLKEVVDPYWGYSPRTAYQKIGTNLMRDQWSNTFWVDCAMRQIKEWMDEGYNVVVPDTRFPNEAEAVLKTAGGELWQVYRPSLPKPHPAPTHIFFRLWRKFWTRVLRDPQFGYDHASEVGLVDFGGWTETLVNDGTVEDLLAKVDYLMNKDDTVEAVAEALMSAVH